MTSSIFDVDWETGEIKLRYGDLFAGAGGFTSGVEIALARMGVRGDAVVVNHDPVAVASHKQNHQNARHYCIDLDAARPEQLVPERHLGLQTSSQSCTHHSRAAGGATKNDQRRADPWHIQRWSTQIDIAVHVVENVAEAMRAWVEANDAHSPWPRATRARLRQLDPAMCGILESLFANDLAA